MTLHAMSHQDHDAFLRAEVERLTAENARLKTNLKSNIKVSTKGAVSLYGMGRFPVTLYASQWTKLFAKQGEIEAFIEANKSQLSFKSED